MIRVFPEYPRSSARDQPIELSGLASAIGLTVAAADGYLREVFVPVYNARFAVAPEQPARPFVEFGGLDLDQILCREEPRQSLLRRSCFVLARWGAAVACCLLVA
jgi:hypothetical protein